MYHKLCHERAIMGIKTENITQEIIPKKTCNYFPIQREKEKEEKNKKHQQRELRLSIG